MPVGTGLGAGIGGGGNSTTAWEMCGLMAGRARAARRQKMPPSVVLAMSETTLYALARKRSGLFGSRKKLGLLAQIPRSHLSVTHKRRGNVLLFKLTDHADPPMQWIPPLLRPRAEDAS
ncbi:hypothetical protein [Rhodococcoides fascians]|uniref:hypothetical protein n=1 Tax=Rhodococcoides fascians TaxID=1828 RepID=UPI000B2DA85D|nr:hypothetical protein [Rhodococcus fascians]